MASKSNTTLKERIVVLEVGLDHVCESIQELKNNDLHHINLKIDKLANKVDTLDDKVDAMGIKIGIIVAVLSTIGQAVLNFFLK